MEENDLLVCGGSPDIGVIRKRLPGRDFLAEGELVASGLEDLFDDGIVISTEEGSPFDSLYQPLAPDLSFIAEDTDAAAVSRFRIRSCFQNAGDIISQDGGYSCGPFDKFIGVPLA